MAGRQSRGRQRIPMRRIESQDDLYATFSKRRIGLYKKASELSTLCGADVGIIIFSPTDNPFSFWHPSMESVIQRYRNTNQPRPDDQARVFETNTRARITYLNRQLDELLDEKEQFKEREKKVVDIDKTRQKGCCEEIPVESLNKEQVREWQTWFQDFNSNVKNRINELKNGASISSSAPFQLQKGLSMFHQDVLLGPSYEPYCTGTTSQFIGHNCYNNNNNNIHIPTHGHIPAGHYVTADAEYPFGGWCRFPAS